MWTYIFFLFFTLLSLVHCRRYDVQHFDFLKSASTMTPQIITNAETNITMTNSYQTTIFPIWNGTTTSSTKTSNSTSQKTTPTTPTSTPTTPVTTATSIRTTVTTTTTSGTTQQSTTVPTPTPPPQPVSPVYPWNMTYSPSGNFCVMASFAARIDIVYVNILNQTVSAGLDVPENATVDVEQSHCPPNGNEQVLVLHFQSMSVRYAALRLVFVKNTTNNYSTIDEVQFSLSITADLFPGIPSVYLDKMLSLFATNLSLFDTQSGHSFTCGALIKTNLNSTKVHNLQGHEIANASAFKNGTLETSNLKVQAFLPDDQETESFLPSIVCFEDKTDFSTTIPLVVGLLLLFMIGIVLIAYFIGRIKQQKKANVNYTSM